MSLRVGVDLDGVLADFITAYRQRIIDVTGKDLFPDHTRWDSWNFEQDCGYSKADVSKVWRELAEDLSFWRELPEYPWTRSAMEQLGKLWQDSEADIYFITSRPGPTVKNQTEMWLDEFEGVAPTVLISSEKGLCCKALKLDVYIDDKVENCQDVVRDSPDTLCFMLAQPWNRVIPGVARISTISQFFDAIEDAIHASTT